MQARRWEISRRVAWATWVRRAGTLTIFVDLLHDLDLEIALGHELLQPGVLEIEMFQEADIIRLKRAELPFPGVDRLFAYPMPFGYRFLSVAIRVPKDRHDRFICKS
jgi:hypothetical protein